LKKVEIHKLGVVQRRTPYSIVGWARTQRTMARYHSKNER
jgi:hypothetical protein